MTLASKLMPMWDKLLSPFKQVDKRQLQHEIDIHRLFLLTSYNRLGGSGGEDVARDIEDAAHNIQFSVQQIEVQNNVHQQIVKFAEILDSALLKMPRPKTEAQPKKWQSGLSFAVGGVRPQARAEIIETHPLSKAEVSAIFRERLGFTLECKKSGIDHEEAGEGLFLCGRAVPGTVVSMYPGVIYAPSQYKYMPKYPRVDVDNPYLISRYDGLILDGKPWGRGGESRDWWDGTHVNESDASVPLKSVNISADQEGISRLRQGFVEAIAGTQSPPVPIRRAILERRNPLAFGHFANHPPKHVKPNVMICAYSVNTLDEIVRPYVPNVVLSAEAQEMERRGILWLKEGSSSDEFGDKSRSSQIRTLVLVATRTLEDEELLLNYRLSTHIRTPTWFHSVDEEEDRRRWE